MGAAVFRSIALGIALGSACLSVAQSMHVKWSAQLDPADVRAGESARILVRAKMAEGFYIYAFDVNGPIPTKLTLKPGGDLESQGGPIAPTPVVKYDEGFETNIGTYPGEVVFAIPVRIKPGVAGKGSATVTVNSQACDARGCDPPATDEVRVEFQVAPGDARPDRMAPLAQIPDQTDAYRSAMAASEGKTRNPQSSKGAADDFATDVRKAKDSGLLAFMALSFLLGLAALLTPCVFPMIPITVSFFSKKTEAGRKANLGGATAYCLGIISTFSALGLLVTVALGPTGVQDLATNPWVNFLVFAIFVALALSLFGLFEIGVPAPILSKLGAHAKGVGFVGPLLMGLTFSLTSFTCTVPIVGTILAGAALGEGILFPLMGMIAFSAAFSLPFFFLALFPDFLKALPKSGAWLGQVKIFMGFLELAAAVKFLSNVDLVWQLGWITADVFLAVWAAIAAIAGLQLLGWIRLGTESVVSGIGWARRAIGVATIGASVYCLAAIQGAPLGELEAFLPPDPYPGSSEASTGPIAWKHEYEDGLRLARDQGKPLFVNFTGVTCTNCRWMEKNMFTRPEISAEIQKYVAVELFTDRKRASDDANRDLQRRLTGVVTLPVYVLLSPDEEVLKVFQGSTRNAEEFLAFLKREGADTVARK